jgi:hypothetical protein
MHIPPHETGNDRILLLIPDASNLTGVVWGDESIPGGAIYMRNSTGNRNRQFEVAGWNQE